MATKVAYAIARESSDDRTLQNQYDNILKVAKELGYKIIKEFGENVTGDATKKDGADPDFIEELRAAIKEQKPDAIFCFWIDRLTRTTFKQGAYLNEFSVIPHIPIYFTRKGKWTIDPKTNTIDFDFLAELSSDTTPQKERENIKARTSPQREKLGSEGYFIGHISDGYCVEESWGTYDDGHRRKIKKIIIDNDRRGVIEDIFRYYRNGYSIGKIADILNSNNVPTTNGYRASTPNKFGHRQKYKGKDGIVRERSKAKWNGGLVSQVLSNPWYKGERKYRGDTLTHDAIIPKEEWDEVKALREENKKSFRSRREASKHNFLLSDLFYCGNCGRKMYGHFTGLNNHYYCSSIDFKQKCGLVGICKENVEAIVYDIISNKAINSVFEGEIDNVVTDFFKLDKKEEERLKEEIVNNKKIIAKAESDNRELNKKIDHLVELQGLSYNNPSLTERYGAAINKALIDINNNTEKKNKLLLDNRAIDKQLTANSNIKEILRNIIENKELTTIKQLFKQSIEKVVIFNAEKRDDVIKIIFKNGLTAEFIYCARLLGSKYILLESPLQYDNSNKFIVSKQKSSFIVVDNNIHYFIRDHQSDLKIEEKLTGMHIWRTKCVDLGSGIAVKEFIELVKDTRLALPYERLEEQTELAKEQKKHYQQWRKKFNTGKPTNEPYILHNKTYEEINLLRKKLYNKAYKIKNRKTLSEDEKKERLNAIKKELAVLTLQVPLINPRKKRTTRKDDKTQEYSS